MLNSIKTVFFDFIFCVSDMSFYVCIVLLLLNFSLILLAVFYKIRNDCFVTTLELNLFYAVIAPANKSYMFDADRKESIEKSIKYEKRFLLILFFLIYTRAFFEAPFRFFFILENLWVYFLSFAYIFWSYVCVSLAANCRDYAFPLILNPARRFRFRKRYKSMMKEAYKTLYLDSRREEFLDKLSSKIKKEYDWLSSKNISGEETFVSENLFLFNQK